MSQLPIATAAKRVGRDRKTLYRLVAQGKLTATVDSEGKKQIDTAELIRVFGELRTETTDSSDKRHIRATVTTPQRETPDTTARMAVLEAELRHARELLAVRESQIEDLRRTVLLLEHRKEPRKKGFLGWLRG
jgi:hypothetical protein